MRCQICKDKEATIHLTEITEGARTEIHVCERCAVSQGISIKSQMSINELLNSLLASAPADEDVLGAEEKEISCPHCGFTLEQFTKEAVLGCPYDYEVFEKSLMPLIKKAHDNKTTHCGKVPSKAPADTKKHMEVAALRQQLQKAVQTEDYERAAELRDKIDRYEKD